MYGFSPGGLSDDDLSRRYVDLQAKLSIAAQTGSGHVVGAIQDMLAAIEAEQMERLLLEQARRLEPAVIIETDPDLAAAAAQVADSKRQGSQDRRPKITMRRPVATPVPVVPKITSKPIEPPPPPPEDTP